MYLVYKATYHDTQTSYNWQAHIIHNGRVMCGRRLGIFWDQFSKEFPSLREMLRAYDPDGICYQCRHSRKLPRETSH